MDRNSGEKDQRRHERVDTSLPVRVSTIEADRDPWTGRPYFRTSQEMCANLSRGGAFVRTGELLEPGKRVLLEISLPNGSQVEAIGRVAWTKRTLERRSDELDTGVGIEFLGGASSQLSLLEDFVAQRGDTRGDT
jgi:PilZ domain